MSGSRQTVQSPVVLKKYLLSKEVSSYAAMTAGNYAEGDIISLKSDGDSGAFVLEAIAGRVADGVNLVTYTKDAGLIFRRMLRMRTEEGAGSPNVVGGHAENAIASGGNVRGNVIAGGGNTGNQNHIDGDETRYAVIGGGYDNHIDGVNSVTDIDGAASTISGGAHNAIQCTHATITGGSYNAIQPDADYSVIDSGTNNTVESYCKYSVIIGGDQNTLKAGTDTETSGFRAAIIGGLLNTVWGRNSAILAGANNTIYKAAHYSYAFGNGNEIGSDAAGLNSLAFGDANDVCKTTGSRSIAMGLSNVVDGSYSMAVGRNHVIDGHTYASAFGNGAKTPTNATHVETGRNSSVGNGANQSLRFNMSRETTDAAALYLSLYGSSGYPKQPENSVVDGVIYLVGVDVSNGDTYSAEFKVTSVRVGAANPVLRHNVRTIKDTTLALVTNPALVSTSSGIYRMLVTGVAGKTINWNAAFYGHQIVYA